MFINLFLKIIAPGTSSRNSHILLPNIHQVFYLASTISEQIILDKLKILIEYNIHLETHFMIRTGTIRRLACLSYLMLSVWYEQSFATLLLLDFSKAFFSVARQLQKLINFSMVLFFYYNVSFSDVGTLIF